MMTHTMLDLALSTTHELIPTRAPEVPMANRSIVRVIWGSNLGSTYQRYVPSGSLPWVAAPDLSRAENSVFSMPLTCPNCAGSFELHQRVGHSPDRLHGTCKCCGTSAQVQVGEQGRITLEVLNQKP